MKRLKMVLMSFFLFVSFVLTPGLSQDNKSKNEEDNPNSTVQHGTTPAEEKKGAGTFCKRRADAKSVACECKYKCDENGNPTVEDNLKCENRCKRAQCKCDHDCKT